MLHRHQNGVPSEPVSTPGAARGMACGPVRIVAGPFCNEYERMDEVYVENNFNSLSKLEFTKLVAADHYSCADIQAALGPLKSELPLDYLQFLCEYPNTGIFETEVACAGALPAPCAPDNIYPITLLYARCSDAVHDLMQLRSNQYDLPLSDVLIGVDDGGNDFVLDLSSQHFGQIYFIFSEEGYERGRYLVAESFSDFVDRLVLDAG